MATKRISDMTPEEIEIHREKCREYQRKWRIANRDSLREKKRIYRKTHPDKNQKSRSLAWYYRNIDECRKNSREYARKMRLENPDKVKKTYAKTYAKNYKKIKDRNRRRYIENPDKFKQAALKWSSENHDRAKEIRRNWSRNKRASIILFSAQLLSEAIRQETKESING